MSDRQKACIAGRRRWRAFGAARGECRRPGSGSPASATALAAMCACLAAIGAVFVLAALPASAQFPGLPSSSSSSPTAAEASRTGSGTVTESLDGLLDAARKSGSTVVVISPNGAATDAAAAEATALSAGAALDTATTVRNAISEMLSSLPSVPAEMEAALRRVKPDGSLAWMGAALLVSLLAVAIGFLTRVLVGHWGRSYFRYIYNQTPRHRAEKIGYLLTRTALMWVSVAFFLAGGALLIIIVTPEHGPSRVTALAAISAVALFLWAHDLFLNVFVPDAPEYRLLPLDDAAASRMFRQLMTIFAISTFTFGVCIWMAWFALPPKVHDLLLMLSSILTSAMMIGYVLVHRATIAAMIRGSAPRPSRGRRVAAATWHILAILYLIVATGINVVKIASITTSGGLTVGPVLGPVLGFVAGVAFFGILVVFIDRRFRSQQAELHRLTGGALPATVVTTAAIDEPARAGAHGVGMTVVSFEAGPAGVASPAAPPAAVGVDPITRWRLRWKGLAEHIASIAAFIVGMLVLLAVWGHLEAGDRTTRMAGIGVVLFGAYVLYQIVKTWIDGKIEEEEPGPGVADSEDGMGPGSSRLATLLPLFRNVLLATIVVIAGMVLLSGMGVDVGPLFAGAGVVGLAVGFGAQALIRDIFSGAFFLIDDAFRKGEYIDVGGVMGSVEKISIRSFQLRHHNGPLHTVPFGDIKQLTNYSRDWVVMKLPLRLAYGTDIEKVRKLVKKLGEEMQKDPEIGRLFLLPLKSQGVIQMEDSAMILRVKFMTRPGDQFVTRRHVYTRIHDLFAKEGIHFAHREVTVRIADEDGLPPAEAEERRRKAALGAARAILDDEAAPKKLAMTGPGS